MGFNISTPTVVVVDDNELFLDSLRSWAPHNGVRVAGTATDAAGTLALVERHRPDLVLLDFDLPGVDTLALIAAIGAASPSTSVVMLSGVVNGRDILACLDAGANGYVAKDADLEYIRDAITKGAAGEFVLCELATHALAALD